MFEHADHSLRFLIVATLFIVMNFLLKLLFLSQAVDSTNLFMVISQFSIHSTHAEDKVKQFILAPTVRLNSGYSIPVVGLGTSKVSFKNNNFSFKNVFFKLSLSCSYGNRHQLMKANKLLKLRLTMDTDTLTQHMCMEMKKRLVKRLMQKLMTAL